MNNNRQCQGVRCLILVLMFLTMIPAWAKASITLPANTGWNLLSSTIGLQVADLFGDMQKFTSVWKWADNGTGTKIWAVYLPDGDGGVQYAQSKGFLALTSIASGEGFWVNSKSDQQVVVNGTPIYGELSFSQGWNLVGVKGAQPLAVTDLGAVTSVWKWTAVNGAMTWAVYLPGEVSPGAYAAAKGFGQLTTIQPSEGFWVNLPDASATTTTSTTAASSTLTTTTTTLPASLPAVGVTVPASDDDGDYTVSWLASATSGVTYVLEEATDDGFSTNLREAYSGIHEYAAITARQAGTTYFYRVKATKMGYSDSGWLTGDNGCLVSTENPALTLMVATDTNAMSLAWLPGSDGVTPVAEIVYEIHLSTQEQFTPSSATLVKTVTGEKQATVDGLTAGTHYYGVVVALFSGSQKSAVSNSLQAKTYPQSVAMDPATVVATAADLGLGTFTTTNDSTYLFQGTSGTPPSVNSVLVAEDGSGGMTLRRVTSASKANGEVTVETTAASLTDVFDTASLSTSFKLVDVQQPAQALGKLANKKGLPLSKSMVTNNGSLYSRIDWDDRLLSIEQTNFAYDQPGLTVVPLGKTSTVTLHKTTAAVSESFTAEITATFEPTLITEAEWGGVAIKSLDSAKVAAKGTLSLEALASYHFSAAGSANGAFPLFEKNWSSLYLVGGVPVLQKVTLSMNANAKANAEAKVDAKASALIVEEVEVGAIYNGTTWTPYIVNDNGTEMKASLDIVGKASAEIRLIPEVKVTFYEVLSSSLTVEPFVNSSLTFAKTTNNLDFLTLHPERLIQLTSFDAAMGMESNALVNLSGLGMSWDILPQTCVLGSGGSCLNTFAGLPLFSLPELTLTNSGFSGGGVQLQLQAKDGVADLFAPGSVQWEVFPQEATITPGGCGKVDKVTTCTAMLTLPANPAPKDVNAEYAVFASGQGILGTVGRQFTELTVKAYQGITLSQGNTPVTAGGEGYDFGGGVAGIPMEVSFTVGNEGLVDLIVDSIQAVGTNDLVIGNFSNFANPIPPGGKASFKLIWTPSSTTTLGATVIVTSNDPANPEFSFTVKGGTPCPQTVTYKGREWQKCGSSTSMDWAEANAYCANSTTGGYGDWFLPSIDTLRSLIFCSNGTQVTGGYYWDGIQYVDTHPHHCGDGNSAFYIKPSIDPVFIIINSFITLSYWSSTTNVYDSDIAWDIFFKDGGVSGNAYKMNTLHVRCVRGGP